MLNETTVAKRVTRRCRQRIDGRPSDVFPLLCPVRERERLCGRDQYLPASFMIHLWIV